MKFSSLFQDFFVDEERMLRVYEQMGTDMVVYLHAGPPQATPERIARILAAHFGGYHMLDEARKHLVGRDLYLDTSRPPPLRDLDPEIAVRMIEEHGPHRVLFASDYHAGLQDAALAAYSDLPLSPEANDLILWRNASELLGPFRAFLLRV